MKIELFQEDLPSGLEFIGDIAVDTEAMGLNVHRDRLCVVQLTDETGKIYLVQYRHDSAYDSPNLKALLEDSNRTKIFHYARFDMMMLNYYLGINVNPVFCTKIASFLVRTYASQHSLKDLCKEIVGKDISKVSQSSDWGAHELGQDQLAYAATDVIYLHKIAAELQKRLDREGRANLAKECFAFLPTRVQLDILGMSDEDIFSHSLTKK